MYMYISDSFTIPSDDPMFGSKHYGIPFFAVAF